MPPFDPPFEDESAPEVWASAHQLAFEWPEPASTAERRRCEPIADPAPLDPAGASPAGASPAVASPAVASPAVASPAAASPAAASPAAAGASAEAKLAVRRFVSVCVEVINGYRPAAHLRRLSRPTAAAGVVAQALAAARRAADLRSTAARTSARASRHGRGQQPAAVLRLRLCEPRPGVVEAAVLLVTGERTWAVAVRMEQHQQAWAATILQLV